MIKDEIKEQQDKLKGKSPKEKITYYLYYYKFHILGVLVAVLCIGMYIHSFIESSKDLSIYVSLVNSSLFSEDYTSLMSDYVDSRQIDTNETPARLDLSCKMQEGIANTASVASSEKLMSLFHSGELDVIVADEWIIQDYATLSAFANLEEVLPDELYDQIKDSLIYYEYEDEGKVPIAFYSDAVAKLFSDDAYAAENAPLIAISNTSTRKETAVDFIFYLFE